jgi:hypothetical protein
MGENTALKGNFTYRGNTKFDNLMEWERDNKRSKREREGVSTSYGCPHAT